MGLISWISKKLGSSTVEVGGKDWGSDATISELYAEACYRELTLWTAIDLIARFVSKCEFKTLKDGKEDKGPEWYRWNIEPNRNQNSSEFIRKLIYGLYYTGECLVIEHDNQILVADSFHRTPYVMYDDVFSEVTVGDFTFSKKFSGAEVLYWNLGALGNHKTVQQLIYGVSESYAKLLAYAMSNYSTSRGSKAIFSYDAIPPQIALEDQNEWLQKQQEKYSKFIKADSGVVTIGSGTKLEGFDRKTTYSNESTRDIRHLVDDISDFTAKALGIHPALLRGDVQDIDNAMDYTLTVCIDPLVDMLREEIVRKSIGREGLAKGYDLMIDTRTIKHIDLLNIHAAVEKLVGSGVFCINDIRKHLGEPIIEEAWAWQHFITKNYSTTQEALKPAKGGENK